MNLNVKNGTKAAPATALMLVISTYVVSIQRYHGLQNIMHL